jgi:hypothetical protein
MLKPISLLLAFVLILSFAVVGCSPDSGDTNADDGSPGESEETDTDEDPEPIETPDFSYLTGAWTVGTELTEIDDPAMTAAADQPEAQWECTVNGNAMRLITSLHEYEGTLTPEDGGWVYEATATFLDDTGATWTSTIAVHGKPTSTDLDSFAGAMTGTIESDVDGHLYTATWDIEGTRQ